YHAQGRRSPTAAPRAPSRTSSRARRSIARNGDASICDLLFELGEPLFHGGEPVGEGPGHEQVLTDGARGGEPDRLGPGTFGQRGDDVAGPGGAAHIAADGAVEGPAADQLDQAEDLVIARPAVGGALGDVVRA